MHTIRYKEKNEGTFITDLQFDNDKCYLVFNWTINHDEEYPSYRHEIGPSLLVHAKSQKHDFLIEMPVEIPENLLLTKLIQKVKLSYVSLSTKFPSNIAVI